MTYLLPPATLRLHCLPFCSLFFNWTDRAGHRKRNDFGKNLQVERKVVHTCAYKHANGLIRDARLHFTVDAALYKRHSNRVDAVMFEVMQTILLPILNIPTILNIEFILEVMGCDTKPAKTVFLKKCIVCVCQVWQNILDITKIFVVPSNYNLLF